MDKYDLLVRIITALKGHSSFMNLPQIKHQSGYLDEIYRARRSSVYNLEYHAVETIALKNHVTF